MRVHVSHQMWTAEKHIWKTSCAEKPLPANQRLFNTFKPALLKQRTIASTFSASRATAMLLCCFFYKPCDDSRTNVNMELREISGKYTQHSWNHNCFGYSENVLFLLFTVRIHPWLCVAPNYSDALWGKRGSDLSSCFWSTVLLLLQ